MKLLSPIQIRELDAYTIKQEGIDSIELMERAALKFTEWLVEKFDKNKKIKIFCGPGNNGGDGLVVARLLLGKSYKVETYVIASENHSRDFKINEQRLNDLTAVQYLENKKDFPLISEKEIVVDAIFGSGLNRKAEGFFSDVIDHLNNSKAKIISIDIASGLFTDQPNENKVIIQPTHTVSFQLPKLSFLLPQNEKYVGELSIVDIGLNKEFISNAETNYFLTEKEFIKGILKKRNKFSHKGDFGKALIIGGSYGMMGAIVLSTRACLRTGVGLLVSYIPECGYDVLQTAVPENMVITDSETRYISDIPDLTGFNATACGPGLGKDKNTVSALKKLLERSTKPLVLDADALNILSENKEWIEKIPAQSILTPHPKEFERLAGKSLNDYHRLDMLKNLARKIKGYIVLKGAYTAVATPEGKVYFNSTGNPGMATGGSGDVLTGVITSLLAQGYNSFEASVLGVYMHGYAGDIAAKKLSQPSMIASDIIDGIGEFYNSIQSSIKL